MKTSESKLVGKTSRELVTGTRGALHIAHPMSERALCGAAIGSRPGVDAYRGDHSRSLYGFNACPTCIAHTYSGGNEERALGCCA